MRIRAEDPYTQCDHDKVWAGHQGITLRYYWPSLNKDVESYVNKRHSCTRHKSGQVVPAPLGSLPETNLQVLIFVVHIRH
jgi:hypothetical protein